MSKANIIISNIRDNGGLDMQQVERLARADGVTIREYIKGFIRGKYGAHGNTANTVANHYCR